MRSLFVIAFLISTAALPAAAQDGSRMPAGGNMMSSYVDHPHHDPRSIWSQSNRTGQILGQPMLHERAGAPHASRQIVQRDGVVSPHWSAATRGPSKRGHR